MQRGRKSAASTAVSLATTGLRSRLTPPKVLTAIERAMFAELAALNPHLVASDAPLLANFTQAIVRAHRLGRSKDIAGWDKVARLAMALARSLRLTPQSGTDPTRLGRRRADHADRGAEIADEMLHFRAGDGDDDDRS